MKKIITLIIAVHCSLITVHLLAQSCLPEGITFSTQAQIDSFQINYPGCIQIEGDVTLLGSDITNLNGISVLNSVGGKLAFKGTGLTNLTGLENLAIIAGGLSFGDVYFGEANPFLTSLTGLEGLTSIGGDLNPSGAPLVNFTGLDNLVAIGGNFGTGLFLKLTDFEGLGNLTSIGGNFGIKGNPDLTTLTGLENLTSIGGFLQIESNGELTSLSSLANINSIEGSIFIESNEALTSLSGLENVDANSIPELVIINNNSLETCEVQSICDYLANPIAGVEIHDNAPGCNSREEVAEACGVGVDESAVSSQQSAVRVYPNPTRGISDFRLLVYDFGRVTLKIYDLHGREVATVVDEVLPAGEHTVRFDAGSLQPGVYIYRKLDSWTTGKLIKF
jgi:hypothetical protein